MRLDALHRRVVMDARVIQQKVNDVFPRKLPAEYRGRATNIQAFLNRLNTVTEPFGVRNVIVDDPRLPKNVNKMTAYWIAERELPYEQSMADIRLEWHVHPQAHRMVWNARTWAQRRFFFWTFLMHELCHRHQNIYRENRDQHESRTYRSDATHEDIRSDQEYLGDYDEIEAYAHDVAFEMLIQFPELSFTEALSAVAGQADADDPSSYSFFMKAFETSPKHPALKIFQKKIRQWYRILSGNMEFYHSLHLDII